MRRVKIVDGDWHNDAEANFLSPLIILNRTSDRMKQFLNTRTFNNFHQSVLSLSAPKHDSRTMN